MSNYSNLSLGIRSQVSHELRTPLSGLFGFLGLLDATTLTAEQQDYLSHIKESAQQLLHAHDKIDHLIAGK